MIIILKNIKLLLYIYFLFKKLKNMLFLKYYLIKYYLFKNLFVD